MDSAHAPRREFPLITRASSIFMAETGEDLKRCFIIYSQFVLRTRTLTLSDLRSEVFLCRVYSHTFFCTFFCCCDA